MSNNISDLARELEKRLSSYKKTGLIYHAVRLVAEVDGKWNDANQFLTSMKFSLNTPFKKEKQILIEKLDFPVTFIESIKAPVDGFISKEYPETFTIVILIASWIISSLKEKAFEQKPVEKKIIQEELSLPTSKDIILALVIKEKELQDLKSPMALSLDEIIKLLEKATHFLCVFQNEMDDIQKELEFDNCEMDRESEQPNLVIIHFEHAPPLTPQGKTFANKLELTQYFSNGSRDFKVDDIKILLKMGILTKVGFVRT
ncbi:MAG: hypothetical protein HQK65_13015 [Desulfamplus sp.]|nr:hypothetical protein [Desulfamplus sp.]